MTRETVQGNMQGPLAAIEAIQLSQGQLIRTREDLARYVEAPALAPCEELYDKNIRTVSASANRKDAAQVYIDIDEATLSEDNRARALGIGGEQFIDHSGNRIIKLAVELNGNETQEDVTNKLLAVTEQLAHQRLLWASTYTIDDLKGHFGYEAEEVVDPAVFVGEGYFLDPKTGLFHESEELYVKSKEEPAS